MNNLYNIDRKRKNRNQRIQYEAQQENQNRFYPKSFKIGSFWMSVLAMVVASFVINLIFRMF